MKNLTCITLAWELHQQGVSNLKIAKHLDRHRETIGLWIKNIYGVGLNQFLLQYDQAKKKPRPGRQIDPVIKRWIWNIRQRETRRKSSPNRYLRHI